MAANWAGEIAQLAKAVVNPQNALEMLVKAIGAMKGMAEHVEKTAASIEAMRNSAEGNWQKMIKFVGEIAEEVKELKKKVSELEAGGNKEQNRRCQY